MSEKHDERKERMMKAGRKKPLRPWGRTLGPGTRFRDAVEPARSGRAADRRADREDRTRRETRSD